MRRHAALFVVGTTILAVLLSLPMASSAAESSGPTAEGKDGTSSSQTSGKTSGPPQDVKEAFKTLQGIANRIGDEIPKAVSATVAAIKKATAHTSGKAEPQDPPNKDEK
jgi:hypothetical protein